MSGDQVSAAGDDFAEVEAQLAGKIRLVEQDDGTRAAFTRHDQVALKTALVEVVIEAAHNEQHIDVGGQHLFAHLALRLLARELCWRSRTFSIIGPSSRSTTQSPTAGQSAASWRSAPLASASTSPSVGPHQKALAADCGHAADNAGRTLALERNYSIQIVRDSLGDHPLLFLQAGRHTSTVQCGEAV